MHRRLLVLAFALCLLTATGAADSFGDPGTEPVPNVTDIRIHDVTADATPRDGGVLVASGLNTTLELAQQDVERRYRVSFRLANDGSENWTVNDSDTMFHDGLNASWTVGDIWYNLSTSREGGTFADGTVSWNTSNGGELEPGEEIWANYLVNISQPASHTYGQRFLVNDSTTHSGSEDLHDLQVTRLGWLNVSLSDPPNDTIVKQDAFFPVNATVTCIDGTCGAVNATPRYNASATADTVIPGSGTPFAVNTSSRQTCSQDLGRDASCTVTWDVNATGTLGSTHRIDVNASADRDIAGNDSTDHVVTIDAVVLFSLTFDTIDFGPLAPGDTDRPALGNDDRAYNITVDEDSIGIDGLWVTATDLVSTADPSYRIGPSNITTEADPGTRENLSTDYTRIGSNIAPGTTVTTSHWLDVPTGMTAGDYNGTMTFKANATG